MLTLRGEIVAFVGARRWYLIPYTGDRYAEDPDRRAVVALCQALVAHPSCYLAGRDFEPPHGPPA